MAKEDKLKALDAAIAQIEKQYGKGSVMKLGDNSANMNVETVPTGSLSLDIALGLGGLPKGRIIEVYGPESSGKTTVALHCVAEVQKRGGIAGFIDAEHALDPVYTDGGDTLYVMDQISDKKNKEEAWVKNLVLDDALKLLDDRARQIIKLRFFEGKTQIEVAEEINISQAQVSRLEKNALKNMHGYLEA